jgi:hypothetical protein
MLFSYLDYQMMDQTVIPLNNKNLTGDFNLSSKDSTRTIPIIHVSTHLVNSFPQEIKGEHPLEQSLNEEADESNKEIYPKPEYSYAAIITQALEANNNRLMTLSEIYQWITDKYPFFKTAAPGWKVNFK